MTNAAMANSRIGVLSRSAGAVRIPNLLATKASTIARTGTAVDSTHVRTWRWITPGARKVSGTPPRSAATATGRSTRSDCR